MPPGAVHPNKIIAGNANQTGKIEYFKTLGKPHHSGALRILDGRPVNVANTKWRCRGVGRSGGTGGSLGFDPRDPRSGAAPSRRDRRQGRPGAHVVLIFDRAGWHTTPELRMPPNITPIWLPPRLPELNPIEKVWQYLRQNWLSNRAFETYDDLIDTACEAWNTLTAQPAVIT